MEHAAIGCSYCHHGHNGCEACPLEKWTAAAVLHVGRPFLSTSRQTNLPFPGNYRAFDKICISLFQAGLVSASQLKPFECQLCSTHPNPLSPPALASLQCRVQEGVLLWEGMGRPFLRIIVSHLQRIGELFWGSHCGFCLSDTCPVTGAFRSPATATQPQLMQ